jgi:hypothetical protein
VSAPEIGAIIGAAIGVLLVFYAGFHTGHGHANYRHGVTRPHRAPSIWWSLGRGPWISIPGPFGTRIGHRL